MPEERKLVTVLFADVTGSTALGEDLDPEDVRALMSRYYDHARHIIGHHGGTVEKFIGDAVMAVFGLPHAHGDDAERAITSALVLRSTLASDPMLVGLQLRMGINTGEVVATDNVVPGDFLVTGDAVNTAARLQQHALPGEILVSARTYDATRGAFLFAERRDVELKGKREAVPVHPVMALRPARQIPRPPMVGREEDLMMLSLLHRRTLREGRPQLVSIVAPAGTGKTRLLEEFVASVDQTSTRIATGRCLPYGQTLAYWPLRGLLDDLAASASYRETVERAFREGGYVAEDTERLTRLILATVGVEIDKDAEGTVERENIFNAWQLFLETLSRHHPHIIVFEDLHWASDSLLDLVEHVMSPRVRAHLLLIATSRPELLDRRAGWGSGRQSFSSLALSTLQLEETRTLVDALGSDLAAPIRHQIVERSGGNPFFAVELIRVAMEHRIGDVRQAVASLPDTVHATVLSRIDLLTPSERATLQAASVVGRVLRPSTLQSVTQYDLVEVEGALAGLTARDMVVPADEPGTFEFRHVLIRDVAYGMLSRAQRIRMHVAVAQWLEVFAADRLDEFTELIAFHYREAVLLARRAATPLPLPIDPAHAVRFLVRAGELAHESGAFSEARTHILSAIELSSESHHRRLYEKLGDVASFGGWSIEAYGKALDTWRREERPDPAVGARLLRKLLVVHMRWQGSVESRPTHEAILDMLQEARYLSDVSGAADEVWRVRVAGLFWPFFRLDITPEEVAVGRSVGPAAAAYFEDRGDWDGAHEALDGYASTYLMDGDHAGAVQVAQRRLALPGGNVLDRGDAFNMMIDGYTRLGAYHDAIHAALIRRASRRPGEAVAPVSNGMACAALSACLSGEWETLSLFGESLWQAWEELGGASSAGFLIPGFFAMYHVARAREDRAAVEAVDAALDRLLRPESRTMALNFLIASRADDPSLLDLSTGLPVWSRAASLQLMFVLERGVRLNPQVLHALEGYRRWRQAAVDRSLDVAVALATEDPVAVSEAIERAEQSGLIPHAARMRLVLAQLTADASHLELARPVLERLHDRQFLHRLDEVAASLP